MSLCMGDSWGIAGQEGLQEEKRSAGGGSVTSSHSAWRMPRKNQNFSEQQNKNPLRRVEAGEGSDLCDWKEPGWVVASGRAGSGAHTIPSGLDLSLPLPCFSLSFAPPRWHLLRQAFSRTEPRAAPGQHRPEGAPGERPLLFPVVPANVLGLDFIRLLGLRARSLSLSLSLTLLLYFLYV